MSSERSVVSSAKLIAVCTLISRVTGLVRDVLLAQVFGLGWVQSAFAYAFQFPNLFRRLFGEGAMAPVFVPTFSATLETEGRPAARALLARTFALLTAALTVLMVLIALVIGAIALWWPGAPVVEAENRLLLALTALMLPFMVTICLLALLSAMLNCVGSFVPAALAPILLNIAMIVALAFVAPAVYPGVPQRQVYVVALSVVAAGFLQLIVLAPVLRRHGLGLGWHWDPRHAAVRHMLNLLPPVLLGQGVLSVGVFIDATVCVFFSQKPGGPATFGLFGSEVAYPLTAGAMATVSFAQRLYQFPLGVLVISLATAALPSFSRLAARRDWDGWAVQVREALRLAVFEGLLAGVMMVMLATELTRLLYERGRFTPADTTHVAYLVLWYGCGLWAFCAQHIVLRAFYSRGDVRTPLLITGVLLPINVAMSLVLIWLPAVREAAFAISTCVTSSLAVIIGLVVLQRHVTQRIIDAGVWGAVVRMLVAACVAGGGLFAAAPSWHRLAAMVPGRLASNATDTFGLLAIGTLLFVAVAWILRLREVHLLLPHRSRGQALKAESPTSRGPAT